MVEGDVVIIIWHQEVNPQDPKVYTQFLFSFIFSLFSIVLLSFPQLYIS